VGGGGGQKINVSALDKDNKKIRENGQPITVTFGSGCCSARREWPVEEKSKEGWVLKEEGKTAVKCRVRWGMKTNTLGKAKIKGKMQKSPRSFGPITARAGKTHRWGSGQLKPGRKGRPRAKAVKGQSGGGITEG